MQYNGKYAIFDPSAIQTYPIALRTNKVTRDQLIFPESIKDAAPQIDPSTADTIDNVADAITASRNADRPVILFTGAHLIKNGLGPLLADLVQRHMITLVAGNGATAIHDFELALIGQTSEVVPQALEKGQFGMAGEFAYQNLALKIGDTQKLGYGESLGKMICDQNFRNEVLKAAHKKPGDITFEHDDLSVLAMCYRQNVPFTVHVGIGTDVIDQHESFDGGIKGSCSGRDFLIYTDQVAHLTNGGVILNIGSAVTGPEVFLKAASMAGNVDKTPANIVTADFDLRNHDTSAMTDESKSYYYYRDQKSVVTRIPQAFGGRGFYIQGNQKQTFVVLYQKIIERIEK